MKLSSGFRKTIFYISAIAVLLSAHAIVRYINKSEQINQENIVKSMSCGGIYKEDELGKYVTWKSMPSSICVEEASSSYVRNNLKNKVNITILFSACDKNTFVCGVSSKVDNNEPEVHTLRYFENNKGNWYLTYENSDIYLKTISENDKYK